MEIIYAYKNLYSCFYRTFCLLDVKAINLQGQLSDHHGDASRNEASLKGNRAGYVPSMSSANNKPVGMSTSYSRYQRIMKIGL